MAEIPYISLFAGVGYVWYHVNMRTFTLEARRKMSESAKKRCQTEKFKDQITAYWKPVCDQTTLLDMYAERNMTIAEISDALGVSRKRVSTSMRRYGIVPRKATPRAQSGAVNSAWRGDDAGYQALHLRVIKLKGQPKMCQECGISDPLKHYDWANLTGRYTDPSDYRRMCRSCHRKYDNTRRRMAVKAGV